MTDFIKLCVTRDTLKSLRGKGIDSEINAVLSLVAKEMDKKYIVCGLNSSDYSYPEFDIASDMERAKELASSNAKMFFDYDVVEHSGDNGKLRLVYRSDESFEFYVAEIYEIYDPYLVVYHHAYDGVSFRVNGFTTEMEAYDLMNRSIQYALNNWVTVDPEPYEYGDREYTLDDDNQWHHWEFVNVKELSDYPDD